MLAHRLVLLLVTIALLTACSAPPEPPLAPAPAPTPAAYPPVTLPKDEAPHTDLTEWWYYTGHLHAADGRKWGFELVTFQILRTGIPPYYVSHFAIADQQSKQFRYELRSSQGAQAQPPEGFALDVSGWTMRGLLGRDALAADLPEYRVSLSLQTDRPVVLHDGGLISFGAAGDSYYYSRTRMELAGTIEDHGEQIPVTGLAWFDKQWGNFLVLGGGWDWFSIQLDDGTDVMLNLIRDATGETRLAYGTYVNPDGSFRHLTGEQFELTPTGQWTSPRTGATYPSGWTATIRDAELSLTIAPVIPDQEIDTRQLMGLSYWEGAQEVTGTRRGQTITGQGYVELVGYAK